MHRRRESATGPYSPFPLRTAQEPVHATPHVSEVRFHGRNRRCYPSPVGRRCAAPGGADSEILDLPVRMGGLGAVVDHEALGQSIEDWEVDVEVDAHVQAQALIAPTLRHEREAAPDRIVRGDRPARTDAQPKLKFGVVRSVCQPSRDDG